MRLRLGNAVVAMPRLTNCTTRPSGHNGATIPPRGGGGDDGRDGDGQIPDSIPNFGERLRRARLGLAVAMTPIVVLFFSFTAVYLLRRSFVGLDMSSMVHARAWAPVRLPWLLLLFNTLVLISSSVTVELARRRITREAALAPVRSIPGISLGDERHFPWLMLTTMLGMAFLEGQFLVWRRLSGAGFHLTGGTSSSFFYILTAMHGLHLAGGLVAIMSANVAALLNRPVETRRIVVDIASWYWHCMTGLWIYILVLFSFASQ
jgi:cytochrome c oxidase subunit 3